MAEEVLKTGPASQCLLQDDASMGGGFSCAGGKAAHRGAPTNAGEVHQQQVGTGHRVLGGGGGVLKR